MIDDRWQRPLIGTLLLSLSNYHRNELHQFSKRQLQQVTEQEQERMAVRRVKVWGVEKTEMGSLP